MATAPTGPLAWEPPHATGAAPKRQKTKTNKKHRLLNNPMVVVCVLHASWNSHSTWERQTRNKYKILCVSSEERTLLSGEESSLPKEYIKEYKKEIKNKENNNKEILENTKINQLSNQELKELQEIYKAKLKVISDKLKLVAKYNWVDND